MSAQNRNGDGNGNGSGKGGGLVLSSGVSLPCVEDKSRTREQVIQDYKGERLNVMQVTPFDKHISLSSLSLSPFPFSLPSLSLSLPFPSLPIPSLPFLSLLFLSFPFLSLCMYRLTDVLHLFV